MLAQDRGDLVFTERRVPTEYQPGEVSLAASGGRVFVGYSAILVPRLPRLSRLSISRSFVAESGLHEVVSHRVV